jgi:hypothetical protein
MKALVKALSQISGSDTTDNTNAHITTLPGISGSVAIGQTNAHTTTLPGISGSVAIGQTNAHARLSQILELQGVAAVVKA